MLRSLPLTLTLDPDVLASDPEFRPFRPGVDILRFYEDAASGASAALLRYAPGAVVPAHEHLGYEHIFVLAGEQRDERGTHAKGTFVINPPGTSHRVESPGGCLVLVVWQGPVDFARGP